MTKIRLLLAAFLMLPVGAAHAQAISALPAASALGGTEVTAVVQSGATKKATAAQIKTFTNAGLGALSTVTPGTGVATALAINVGSAGAPVVLNGAGGTPSSLTCTNCTGTASGLTAGTVTTNANLTGDVTSSGNATTLATVNSNVGSFTNASITVNAKGLITAASSGAGGSGTVTATGGALTANAVVLGAGTTDTKVVAGVTTDGATALNLGIAGTTAGKVVFSNATSGTGTLQPPTGALGTITYTLPGVTSTLATLGTNTYTALQTITQAAANAGVIASTGYSLTGSDATSMVDLAGTWNTSGNPTLVKANVTNTASGASSLLMDLQVGGVSTGSISKNGRITLTGSGSGFITIDTASNVANQAFSVGRPSADAIAFYYGTAALPFNTLFYKFDRVSNITTLGGVGFAIDTNAFITKPAAATWQLGAVTGSGAAVAQTLQAQGSSGNSAAAALFTIAGSDQSGTTTTGGGVKIRGGNGTSAGGAVEIWTSATTTPAVAVSVAADKTATFSGSFILATSATPAAADACTAGRIVWGADYLYVCTASGAWKRAAITGGY